MVRETMLVADERLEIGQRLTTESLDRAVASEAWPAVAREVQEACRRLGLPWEQAVREFLGAEHAVLRGRVVARGTDDWRVIVRGALSRGLKADARWREHWAAVQAAGWWLPGLRKFADAVGGLANAFAMIHEEAGACGGEIPVRLRSGGLTLDDVYDALRRVSREQPCGLLGAKQVGPLLANRADLPSMYALGQVLARHDMNIADAWRSALGRREALRLGRVRPAYAHDLRIYVSAALEAGVRVRPGWSRCWDTLIDKDSRVPRHERACVLARRFDVCLREVAVELSAERGLPTAPLSPRMRRGGRSKAPQQSA